ncbi:MULTISPECIES: N-acetylmuramoyl-L-alanine amidase [Streptomyces]|uniref:N-acetylmuramoyl-L-alanine amidase n=1 Tax=Streptomyces lycii TaxID=2654337 RepID=A0ABQ7F9I4_9ACTN|nr:MULTISPECIES: N-acetylmuramoyl-L-alanine amidase [Streptomyces]KAF4405521.1 N-acetylmuramoyl-L-alanine amidase [Streptomyces lycii]PGH48315.1 N-acetylmuramoyl-L-alanine amidase [Streptomyces sp. Ru87]
MATPLSAARQLAALKAEGCKVVEYKSWRSNNRNHKGSWGPVHGVMIHHTVTSGTDSSVALCYNGHSSLPGPLCHTVGAKDGTLYMVGNGRANHAGLGDDDVLRAVIAERSLPADNEANTDGNRHFYGIELINLGNGRDPWPAAQVDAAARWAAALCRAHGWNERSVIGHLEWQPGKIDPRGFTMSSFRTRVKNLLANPPGTGSSEDDMPQYINLGRTAGMQLSPDVWDAIEWDTEWTDQPGDHATGGSQFLHGPALYTGEIDIRVSGLPVGEQFQVRLSEVNDGEYTTNHPIGELIGTAGDTFAKIPITGRLPSGRGARIRVKHWHSEPVTVTGVLKVLVWAT